MNNELLQTALARLEHLAGEAAGLIGSVDTSVFLVAVGALIWLQLLRITRTLGNGRGASVGSRRIENLESDVKQLNRELHALHAYVTTNTSRQGAE